MISSVTRRRIRLSPILITPLIGVIFTLLFSISELATGLFIAITLLGLLFGMTEMVDKKVTANIKNASKAGTVGKRKLKILNWPKDSLRQGTRSFGLSALLFFIQIAVDSAYIPFLSSHDIFTYGAVALGLVGGFYTALTGEFIHNPEYRPRITLAWTLLGLIVGVTDAMTVFFLIMLCPTFVTMPVIGKVFTMLLIPSIVSSILFLWANWTRKSTLLVNVTFILVVTPYVYLIALFLIVYALLMISY